MKRRTLGPVGPEVSALGKGCLGMSGMYGDPDGAACIAVGRHALVQGVAAPGRVLPGDAHIVPISGTGHLRYTQPILSRLRG